MPLYIRPKQLAGFIIPHPTHRKVSNFSLEKCALKLKFLKSIEELRLVFGSFLRHDLFQ
jgi:hypothetical protein